MAKVAIVTPDIMGPIANGGIGTAFYFLACHLAHKHEVTIFFAPEVAGNDYISKNEFNRWVSFYQEKNVTLLLMPDAPLSMQGAPMSLRAYNAFYILKDMVFDFIHFPDLHGLGYFCSIARSLGLGFENTKILVHLHGPTLWHREGSGDILRDQRDVELNFLEKSSIEKADSVISPSQWMADWVRNQGWKTKEKIQVIGHAPVPVIPNVPHESRKTEVMFLGRLENRKGFPEFVEALNYLPKDIDVTIFGRSGEVNGEDGKEFLKRRIGSIQQEVNIYTNKNHLDTLEYIARVKPLVIMPSLLENSPCGVFECLTLKTNFITTNTGGTAELFKPNAEVTVFTEIEPRKFANSILHSLNRKTSLHLELANYLIDAPADWNRLHQETSTSLPISEDQESNVSISICIATKNRPEFLDKALKSLTGQTDKKFEVIVVNDGSETIFVSDYQQVIESYKDQLKISYFAGESLGAGGARNSAAEKSNADFLFFMDDDNLALPNEIEIFKKSLQRTKVDILTCVFERFPEDTPLQEKKSVWIPLGNCPSMAPFMNVFGDTNFLVARRKFLAVGGFDSSVELGEDWDLLWRMSENGLSLEVIPIPLFQYRDHQKNQSISLIKKQKKHIHQPTQKFLQRLDDTHRDLAMVAIGKSLSPQKEVRSGFFFNEQTTPLQTIDVLRIQKKLPTSNNVEVKEYKSGLSLTALPNDPFIVFDLVTFPINRPTLELRIYSDSPNSLQIYVQRNSRTSFDEDDVLHLNLTSGWNEHSIKIELDDLVGPLRIDFGDTGGIFFISSLRILTKRDPDFTLADFRVEPLEPFNEIGPKLYCLNLRNIQSRNLEITKKDNDYLSFIATTDDPQIRIEANISSPAVTTTFYLKIVSPDDTTADLFYQFDEQSDYPPNQRISFKIKRGLNELKVALFHRWPVAGWRLDPGSTPGNYEIALLAIER